MNRFMIPVLSLITFSACSQSKKIYESPAGYDFNKPVVYKMPEQLMEISGIAFYPGKKDVMYAIQDEDGKVFYWKNGQPETIAETRFAKHGDFEDVAITNNDVFVLRSDGTLFQFPLTELNAGNITNVKEWKGLIPSAEYESLYADNQQKSLYVLCKNCPNDKGEGIVSGYIMDIGENGSLAVKSTFSINTQQLAGQKKKQKTGARPSAMAFNPQSREWYLLSSVTKKLIIANEAWEVKQAINLNSTIFPQPEGITFDSDNNLYISNEAGNSGAGTVLKFVWKNSGH